MLRYPEALQMIQHTIQAFPVTETSWRDALHLTLATDIHAVEDVPLYDNAAMDGFAVRAEDTEAAGEQAPVFLRIIEAVYAGSSFPQKTLSPGQASKIMTGAPVPQGANAVVMVEHTRSNGETVEVFQSVHPGQNIRKLAEEIRKNTVILSNGTRIGSAEQGLLASQGILRILVRRNAEVAILPTGNELVEPEEKTREAQIRNVNGYTLASELSLMGCQTHRLGIGRDVPDTLQSLIESGLERADVLLTSGGVSMGEKDLLPAIFQKLGVRIHFHKVSVKPGKPLLFGDWNGKYIFGLPGNVVSTLASFHLFVKPALRLLAGRRDWKNPVWYVRSGVELHNPGGRTNFIRCYLNHSPTGMPIAFPTGKQGSGMLSSLAGADGFAVIPSDIEHVDEHQPLEFIPLHAD